MEIAIEEVLVGSVDIKAWRKSERVFNTSRSTAEDVLGASCQSFASSRVFKL